MTARRAAHAAAAEFDRRRAWLHSQLHAGKLTESQAEKKLRPWAAIALRAGATPTPLAAELAARIADRPAIRPERAEAWARLSLAEDLCPLPRALEELGRAHDAAVARIWSGAAGDMEVRRTMGLVWLAIHLGVAAWAPAPIEQRAAA